MKKEKWCLVKITWNDGLRENIEISFDEGIAELATALGQFDCGISHAGTTFWNLKHARKIEIEEV